MIDWAGIRAGFPALSRWTYLNSATFGQIPRRGVEAVARVLTERDELALPVSTLFGDLDGVRESIARLINAGPRDIGFVSNAAQGLGLLLSGIDWKAGDQVLTLDDEFPNQIYALGDLARLGVEMIHCPWDELEGRVTERTRLVALSSANYNNGFVPPLEGLGDRLRARGVLLYVDGTQSVGALRFDTAKVAPDVLAVHAYKWMLAPNGVGFVCVSERTREWLRPNTIGWRSHSDWRNVDNLHHGAPEFVDAAEKYEGGGIAASLIAAMGASVDWMLEIGPSAIEDRVLELADRARVVLRGLGAIVEEGRTAIVAAKFPQADPSVLAAELRARKVQVAARKGRLRVSPHFYNNEEDLATLDRELRAIIAR